MAAEGDEAVRVWQGVIHGSGCVLVAWEFGHLGGSMGAGVGARAAEAFDVASAAQLPLVAVTSTGGSRMQEGVVALAQMARTVVAAQAHAAEGLLQIAVLADPTTGGVWASFVQHADLLVAVDGAYVGFAGPRVHEAMVGVPPTAAANTAAFALAHGLVDAVVAQDGLRRWLSAALVATDPADEQGASTRSPDAPGAPSRAPSSIGSWEAVQAARAPTRPTARAYVQRLAPTVELRGDRAGGTDDGVVAALGRLAGSRVAVAGLDRRAARPAGYRTVQRLLVTAGRLGIPVLTLVDTPGADPTAPSEAAGLAAAIGGTLGALLATPVPTVALIIGEGGSGGAMALTAADVVLVQRTAIFSVIGPEGAAAILHRDRSRGPEVAERLRLTAPDLVDLGIADAIVDDDPDAALHVAADAIAELAGVAADVRLARRRRRWRTTGDRWLRQPGA